MTERSRRSVTPRTSAATSSLQSYGDEFIYWRLGSIRTAPNQASSKAKGQSSKAKAGDSKAKAGDSKANGGSKSAAGPAVSKSQPNRRRLYALPQRSHDVTRASLSRQAQPNFLTRAPGRH